MQYHPGSESGVPNPSKTGEEFCTPAKTRKVGEDKRNSGADTTPSASSCASPSSEPADDTKESPQLKSSPLDHPEAHAFASSDLKSSAWTRDVGVRSVSDALGGEPVQGDGEQPRPCFTGWHTTDVEQYKGVDVRCHPGPGGKCLGVQMKHRPHFENLDRRAKYNQIDTEDDGGTLASVDKRRFWERGILVRRIIGVKSWLGF